MLYIKRFDSLREIIASLQPEARKLRHLSLSDITSCSTLADANKRKLISLLTNDMESYPNEIIAICRQRWEVELLFKLMK